MSSGSIVCLLLAGFLSTSVTVEASYGSVEMQNALHELFDSFAQMNGEDSSPIGLNDRGPDSSFDWRDCGGSTIHLKSLRVSPIPLPMPGTATISLNATVDRDINTPRISVDLKVEKKVPIVGWVNVCKHVPGGCYRDNICPRYKQSLIVAAVEAFQSKGDSEENDINVCQLPKGTYSESGKQMKITDKAPSGEYKITAKFMNEGRMILCTFVQLRVR